MAAAGAAHARPHTPKRPPVNAAPDLFDSPDSASLLPHEWAWQQHFAQNGFVRTPHSFFNRLPFGFSSIEMAAVGLILQRTVGAPVSKAKPHRPEWVAITQAEIARLADASENGVGAALKRLLKWGVLESRPVAGNKRANEYRVNLANWGTVDVKAARKERATLPADPGADEPGEEDAEDTAPTDAPHRGPWSEPRRCKPGATATISFSGPAKKIALVNETGEDLALSIAQGEDGVMAVRVERRTEGERTVKDSPSRLGNQTASPPADSPTPLGESGKPAAANASLTTEAAAFATELDATFAANIGAPVPGPLVAAQHARLVAASVPLNAFWRRARKRAAAFTEWGFLVNVVDDVVAVAAIERGKVRAMPQPATTEPETEIITGESGRQYTVVKRPRATPQEAS